MEGGLPRNDVPVRTSRQPSSTRATNDLMSVLVFVLEVVVEVGNRRPNACSPKREASTCRRVRRWPHGRFAEFYPFTSAMDPLFCCVLSPDSDGPTLSAEASTAVGLSLGE